MVNHPKTIKRYLEKALQKREINRIQKAYQLDFKFSAIGNDVSNIYY